MRFHHLFFLILSAFFITSTLAPSPADYALAMEIFNWIQEYVEGMRKFICSRCHDLCPEDVKPNFMDDLRASSGRDVEGLRRLDDFIRANIVRLFPPCRLIRPSQLGPPLF
jgi:hypothetical protein